MIALIQIALDSRFLRRPDDEFPLVSWEGDVEGIGRVKAVVYPPYQSELSTSTFRVGDAVPLINDFEKLNPATPQVTPLIEIDGTPVVECDAIAVEFHAVDFDRIPGRSEPLIELALSVVNDFINRIRAFSRARAICGLSSLNPRRSIWRSWMTRVSVSRRRKGRSEESARSDSDFSTSQ